MKKPIRIDDKEFVPDKDMIKAGFKCAYSKQCFCPVCGKPTSEEFFTEYKDGVIEHNDCNMDKITPFFYDPKFMGITLTLALFPDKEDVLDEEYQIDINIDGLETLLKEKFAELLSKHDDGEQFVPYFCSGQCVQDFIKSTISRISIKKGNLGE